MKSRPNPFLASALTVALALPALADITIPQGLNNIDTTGNPALGVITRNPGGIAWFNTAGTATATGTTLSNGIIGPWAFIGTGTNTRYATLDGSNNVVAYTGYTDVAYNAIPNGGSGTLNYRIISAGSVAYGSGSRNINSITSTTGTTTLTWGNSSSQINLVTNGIVNAGSGVLTLTHGGSNANSGIMIGANNGRELVVSAASANISLGRIIDNSAGASAVTITGPNVVTLSGANTFTGALTVTNGSTLAYNNTTALSAASVLGSGAITTTGMTIGTTDFTGFSGTFTHNGSSGVSTQLNAATATSKDAAYSNNYGLAGTDQGLIAAGNGNYTLEMGSLTGVANSVIRGGNAATGTTTLEIGNLNTDTTFAGDIRNGNTKVLALTKVGNGTLTLSGTNTYTGATAVTKGTLAIDGSTAAGSAVTVAAGTASAAPLAILAGKGTVGGNVSLTAESASGFKNGGVLAPTAAASGTKLTVSGTTTFNTGSIFEWNMSATTPGTDPGVVSNSGTYGQLAGTGAITGSDAVFKIVLGAGNAFTDAFWNTNKTWNNLFTGTGATTALTGIFSSIGGAGITYADSKGTVDGQGYFTLSGTNTLSWTAVPEPTSALAGLLLTAGLLRRRRA